MLISFSRRVAKWRLCSGLCSSPPPSLSCWNCSKIRRECLKERERKKEKRISHTPSEWWILFGLCLLSLSLAVLVCYVGFYGEKHRPCQTWLVQGIKKKHVERRGGGGITRKTWFQEFRGCGITERKTRQTESICAADQNAEAKTAATASVVSRWINRQTEIKLLLRICTFSKTTEARGVWQTRVCKGLCRMKLPITKIRTDC